MDKISPLTKSPIFIDKQKKEQLKRDSCLEFVMAKDNILTGKLKQLVPWEVVKLVDLVLACSKVLSLVNL